MSKNPQERKRREKAAAQRRRERDREPLAYYGDKYKTEKLIKTLMQTEIGILEAYVATDKRLTDKSVQTALETLTRALRNGTIKPLDESKELTAKLDGDAKFVIDLIQIEWRLHFKTHPQPLTEDLVGILRTILSSVETMKSPAPFSQSYLKHIERFMADSFNVSVWKDRAEKAPVLDAKQELLPSDGKGPASGEQ